MGTPGSIWTLPRSFPQDGAAFHIRARPGRLALSRGGINAEIARDPPRDVCAIAMTQMPPLPGHGSHLEVHGCSSLGAVGPHDHGRVHALPERPSHSKPQSLVLRNPIARPIERAGCRPSLDGGTGAALRGHDRNDGLSPYRPPWKTNDGDLDCGTSCPLSGLNEWRSREDSDLLPAV